MGLFDRFKSGTVPPQKADAHAWFHKGVELNNLYRHQEAIQCYDKALKINPQYVDAQRLKRMIIAPK